MPVHNKWAMYDEEEASVLCCADTLEEARQDIEDFGFPGVIFEYDIHKDGKTLLNGRMV